jgi:hypothetical protein
MFTLEELSRQIAACNNGSLSIQQFVDWFEGNCAGAYEIESLRDATVAVDAALSEYHYDEIDEDLLKKELAVAVRPFALSELAPVDPYSLKKAPNVFAVAAVVVVLAIPVAHTSVSARPILKQDSASTMTASNVAGAPAAETDVVVL